MSLLPPARLLQLAPQKDEAGREESPIALSIHEGGEGPAVVLCHGFPELAYSWRHQYRPLVEAGFHIVVPDQRGYGASDAPEGSSAYDIDHLTLDLVHLLDALEIEKAVFVGHDWGGFVAWAMPILHPERTLGVIGVNTPYLARPPIPPTQAMSMMSGGDPEKIYILWFQEPGVAEAVLDREPGLMFSRCSTTRSLPTTRRPSRSPATAAASAGTATSTATGSGIPKSGSPPSTTPL